MSLIKSISGIRGTVGGAPGDSLSPLDIVKFTAAYARLLKADSKRQTPCRVVVGRDARISGPMVRNLVCGTLMACGIDVVDIGPASTPTTEMAVGFARAQGGIIITASHNPVQWNALKLLDAQGRFLNAAQGEALLQTAAAGDFDFVPAGALGSCSFADFSDRHIEAVLKHPMVDVEAIRRKGFTVVLDAVNSVGGIIMPRLLEAMGVKCICLNCEPTGLFAHNPEPLPEHLQELSAKVKETGADAGISVDPDVDRLALVCEDGSMFGEEYTLVACADYVLSYMQTHHPEEKLCTVSNLSSTRALKDLTIACGGRYFPAAVGEVNVVNRMFAEGAVIGGEGNGGVILPSLHPGRDALIGTALFLSHLAHKNCTATALRDSYPAYHTSKNRIDLPPGCNPDGVLAKMREKHAGDPIITIDGLRIDFEAEKKWVQVRKSNTEPIIRVYAEAPDKERAEELAQKIMQEIRQLL